MIEKIVLDETWTGDLPIFSPDELTSTVHVSPRFLIPLFYLIWLYPSYTIPYDSYYLIWLYPSYGNFIFTYVFGNWGGGVKVPPELSRNL